MKRIFIYILITLSIVSCNKDETENYPGLYLIYPEFITAGQVEGPGIRYLEFEPDSIVTDNIILDLNNDNIDDFEVSLEISDPSMLGMGWQILRITPLGLNAVITTELNKGWIDTINYNDTINKYHNWSDSTAVFYEYYWSTDWGNSAYGYWYNDDNHYCGIKININNIDLFGWIELKKNRIKRYAITMPCLSVYR